MAAAMALSGNRPKHERNDVARRDLHEESEAQVERCNQHSVNRARALADYKRAARPIKLSPANDKPSRHDPGNRPALPVLAVPGWDTMLP